MSPSFVTTSNCLSRTLSFINISAKFKEEKNNPLFPHQQKINAFVGMHEQEDIQHPGCVVLIKWGNRNTNLILVQAMPILAFYAYIRNRQFLVQVGTVPSFCVPGNRRAVQDAGGTYREVEQSLRTPVLESCEVIGTSSCLLAVIRPCRSCIIDKLIPPALRQGRISRHDLATSNMKRNLATKRYIREQRACCGSGTYPGRLLR